MHRVRVETGSSVVELDVEPGRRLRDVLLSAGLSPYGRVTAHANCGGRGLCATCGVRLLGDEPGPTHWHDRAAQRWGYPRLSCQIVVDRDLDVRLLPNKWVWGQVWPRRTR
ncbi:MAG: 2Fe-2S iron-sulfur cluster-binding protein [Myxococcota bacterium]